MISKKTIITLFLIFTLLPICKIYAQSSNAGFVPGNIWFSIDPFEEGDKIKIYTVIFNPDSRELSGTVIFFDNSVFLGKKDFVAPAKSIKDVSIDWTAAAGTHNIFGKIENAKFLISKEKYEEVYLAGNKTEESIRTVNKKIILKAADTTDTIKNSGSIIDSISTVSSKSIENVEKIIAEKTPDSVAKPIALTASIVEEFRSNTGTASKNKKEEVKNKIQALNDNPALNSITDSKISSAISTNKFLKPFKYIELFFFTFLSFIFNNKFIFYGILITIIFLILRYVWRLIF